MSHYDSKKYIVALTMILALGITLLGEQSAPALDSRQALTQYDHDTWTSQDDMPGEAVYEIVQTQEGYLWLRTSSGLVRFDGARFVQIDPILGKEPLRETVKAICRSVDGDLLIRSATRTLLYKDGTFSDYLPPAPLPKGTARLLYETRAHQVWVGADNFIYLAQTGGFAEIQGETGWTFCFLEDHQGNLWIGGTYALYQYSHGRLKNYSARYGLHEAVTAVTEDRQGDLWVGMRNGLYRLHNGKPIRDSITDRFAKQQVSAILQDHNGNLWVGTDNAGLYRLANGKWSAFTASDGLTDNSVLSLYEDREGSLWVGTRSGLDRFRATKLTTFTTKEGLAHNDTSAIVEAQDGSLFVFSEGGGLTRLKDGKTTIYTTKDGLGSNYGNGLYADRDGSIWIGTTAGLSRFKDGKITNYTDNGRLTKFAISAISADDSSLLVASSDCQVRRFKEGRFYPYTVDGKPTPFTKPSKSQLYVFTIYRDPSGTLWFGVSATNVQGLYKIPPTQPFADARQRQIDFEVTSIYDDRKGNLWLSGKIAGLTRFRIRDGRVTRYTSRGGLFDDEISCILGDRHGDLWMSTARGLFTVSRADLDDFADGKIKAVRPIAYGIADGMKTAEAQIPEHQPAGCKTRDGKLWFATRKGIVMVDPDHLPHNELIPPVILEQVVVDQETYRPGKPVRLSPGTEKLEFHYTALSLLIPQRVQFKYRLEGYDPDWVDAGNRRVAYYTSLPPGHYRFRVIAANNDGVWNTGGASFEFTLLPHFYETRWFYGLFACLILLSGVGLHRLRVQHLKVRERELVQVVAERTQDLKAEIGVRRQAEVALRQAHDELEQRVEQRTVELAQANASLRVEVAERTRAEEALRQSEEAERRFSERLMNLQTVINELSRAATFDDLCRQAVELGHKRLGFDRMGIWFTTNAPEIIQGSFGTDEHGQVRDERQELFKIYDTAIRRLLAHKIPVWFEADTPLLNHRGEVVGQGSSAAAALWDGEKVVGLVSTDNLIERRPITEHSRELLILYATALGYLCSRKRAEEQTKRALAEKEVLLKEVHHRVKNNLQILSSLLKLQSDFIHDPQDRELLQESQHRIKSMAVIHEQLYQAEDLARIDFGEYVRRLTTYLFRSYGTEEGRVQLLVEAEEVPFDLDTAIPCGLILNELVTNALKHAFPEDRKGTLSVRLRVEGESWYSLEVSDDGIGIPQKIDIRNSSSMGLDLVTMLVEQLRGRVELDRSRGTTFRITFPSGQSDRSKQDGDAHTRG